MMALNLIIVHLVSMMMRSVVLVFGVILSEGHGGQHSRLACCCVTRVTGHWCTRLCVRALQARFPFAASPCCALGSERHKHALRQPRSTHTGTSAQGQRE